MENELALAYSGMGRLHKLQGNTQQAHEYLTKALQIFERNRGYRIEFPNYTTLFSPELVARLASIVGADNVVVEPLRLH